METKSLERIRYLEQQSSALEPDEQKRRSLTADVFAYAEEFIQEQAQALAFRMTAENGAGLYAVPFKENGRPLPELLALLNDQVDTLGTNTASPRHMAYIPGGPLYYAALGDYLAAITNRYSGHFYGSPGAVRMENMLLRWMAELIDYPSDSAGNLTSGGSIAHLIGIVTAREANKLKSGDYEKSVVYLTAQAHHSFEKALHIAGMGTCVLRQIPMDTGYRMIPDALAEAIQQDQAAGLHPWMVMASAGTTNSGAVDPLAEIGHISQEHGLWYHIDGAYGGFFRLCGPGRKILQGFELSNSAVLDPHKGLFMPFGTGAVLVRSAQLLYDAFNAQGAYMQDALENFGELSPADLSPELTRHFRGLRLWLSLQLAGIESFAAALEEKLLLARYFYETIQPLPAFEPGPAPDLSIVTFRCLPKSGDINEFNRILLRKVQADGRILLSSTELDGKFVIRLAVLGHQTHLEEINLTLEFLQEKIAQMSH